MSPESEPVIAPSEAPVSRYRRVMDRLRELRTPHEVKPPVGLGCFILIFISLYLVAALGGPFREIVSSTPLEKHDHDAMPIGMRACQPLMSVWLTLMGTIYAFQPRKRWFGYVCLAMVVFMMLGQLFTALYR